mmetsp:Transcript_30448/g.90260  ORF Transcript_30448/g.90260 Transcript_30448/m.90260 type:complete len:254 (-) Transcript_30448:861-1622(-)
MARSSVRLPRTELRAPSSVAATLGALSLPEGDGRLPSRSCSEVRASAPEAAPCGCVADTLTGALLQSPTARATSRLLAVLWISVGLPSSAPGSLPLRLRWSRPRRRLAAATMTRGRCGDWREAGVETFVPPALAAGRCRSPLHPFAAPCLSDSSPAMILGPCGWPVRCARARLPPPSPLWPSVSLLDVPWAMTVSCPLLTPSSSVRPACVSLAAPRPSPPPPPPPRTSPRALPGPLPPPPPLSSPPSTSPNIE